MHHIQVAVCATQKVLAKADKLKSRFALLVLTRHPHVQYRSTVTESRTHLKRCGLCSQLETLSV